MNVMKAMKAEATDSLSGFSSRSEFNKGGTFLEGPSFNPKDYMISPSNSDTLTTEKTIERSRIKLLPADLKMNANILEARRSLKKLQKLLKDKLGRNLIERQKKLLNIIVKAMPMGFLMEDIASVTEIAEYFAFNHKYTPEYIEMINVILEVAMKPPRMMKSSDVLHYKTDLSNYFTMLGELLAAFDDLCIHFRVLEILDVLLVRPFPLDVSCVQLPFCYDAAGKSLFPYILASFLETVCDNLYHKYLDIAFQLAVSSDQACVTMIQSGAIEYILCRLDPLYGVRPRHDPPIDGPCPDDNDENEINEYYRILDLTSHLLWTFLNTISDFSVVCKSPTQNALWSLRYALRMETRKQNRRAILMRNNLIGIVVKLYAVFGKELPMVQSGLAEDVAMLSVASEVGTENSWARDIRFGTSKEDFILKELTLLCCCELVNDDSVYEILKRQRVIEGILYLINPDLTKLSVPWIPSQFMRLLMFALPILSELVPIVPDIYVANKGNTRLLIALEWFKEEHFDKVPLLEILKTLSTLVCCENNVEIIQDFKDQQGVKALLNLWFYILDCHSLKKDHQDKLIRIFIILEKVHTGESNIQSRLGEMYVAVSIKFLGRAVENMEGSKFDPSLLICFCGFLWKIVASCSTMLKSFSEQKGIYFLLDLLQISSYPVQLMFLGLLVDIVGKDEILTYLVTWRSADGYGLLNTMIRIWKKEEFLNKVPRTKNGCVADVERPLMSEEQWYLTYCVGNPHSSPAIAEMMCNARPKIHSLYRLIKDGARDRTLLNESLYSMNFSLVQPEHQVYIPLIENFLIIKRGEIWHENYRYLIHTGLVPIAMDGEVIDKLLVEKNLEAYRLKIMQEEILNYQKMNNSNKEGELYNVIKSCCLTSSLDALHELDYIVRTSYKDIQRKKKNIQLKELEESMNISLDIDDAHIHRTAVRDSNVSYLCGKYVWFKSEREFLSDTNLVKPVSLDSESGVDLEDIQVKHNNLIEMKRS